MENSKLTKILKACTKMEKNIKFGVIEIQKQNLYQHKGSISVKEMRYE